MMAFAKCRAHWLLIAGVFLGTNCLAQELSKTTVEFSAGIGLPVGVFASKKNKIESGLAMTGYAVNLEFNHYFKPKLGFCVGVKNIVFPLDVDAWTNSNPNATSDPWKVLMAYGGLATRKRLRAKTILSLRAAIGLTFSQYPEATVITYYNFFPVQTTFSSNTGKAVSLVAGASWKYILSERIHLGLNLDYLSASPKFVVKREVYYNGQTSSVDNLHYTQNIQAFTAAVSVSYNFVSND